MLNMTGKAKIFLIPARRGGGKSFEFGYLPASAAFIDALESATRGKFQTQRFAARGSRENKSVEQWKHQNGRTKRAPIHDKDALRSTRRGETGTEGPEGNSARKSTKHSAVCSAPILARRPCAGFTGK